MTRRGGPVLIGNSSRSHHGMVVDMVLRLPLMVLVLSCLYAHTDSETSHYTWRLDGDKVMPGPPPPAAAAPPTPPSDLTSSSSSDKDRDSSNETGSQRQQSAQELAKMQEEMLEILLSTETAPDGTWKKTWSSSRYCSRCQRNTGGTRPDATDNGKASSSSGVKGGRNNRGILENDPDDDDPDYIDDDDDFDLDDDEGADGGGDGDSDDIPAESVLDCGRPVNFTYYDHLVGIQNRADHPHIPEPEVALTFNMLPVQLVQPQKHKGGKGGSGGGGKGAGKNGGGGNEASVNIDDIERALKKAKREKPKSVELYNQIGNFWRIRGDTQKSIECFRRALAVSPNNADILLNLARVLFNLQYLDDAIVLTRRSLEVQPPDQNAWAQHFQLGEILKAYCHYQEAALHLRHVLELKPNYGPALTALADMEAIPDTTVHVYTVIIIVCLVMGVLAWVLSTLDIGTEELLGFSFTKASSSSSTNGSVHQANGTSDHHHNGSGPQHKNGKHHHHHHHLQKLRNNGKRSS